MHISCPELFFFFAFTQIKQNSHTTLPLIFDPAVFPSIQFSIQDSCSGTFLMYQKHVSHVIGLQKH